MSSRKGKNIPSVEQLNHGVANISLPSEQEQDDGEWEVISRKSKNKAGSNAAKQPQWVPQNSNSNTKTTWAHSEATQKQVGARNNSWSTKPAFDPKRPAGTGRGNTRPPQSSTGGYDNGCKVAPSTQPLIRPPLEHGWNWQARQGAQRPKTTDGVSPPKSHPSDEVEDDDLDAADDDSDEDDELLSDEFDSDSSEKSHDTLKKSKWFVKFFKTIDELKIDDVTNPERQWHCPACQGGPGAIDWYRGLQPLMTHAKTKGGERMKLHRKLADLLEEDLKRKGTSVVPPGEVFGRWKGLQEEEKDFEIVWPPMVIIMNTRLEEDENQKWIGMGNQELLEYFNSYHPMKARHSYGPQGHRGMSVLIFEASARGYLEAERLHKHFVDQGTDRNAWNSSRRRQLFYQGGKRLLYGFLAVKEDLDVFNQHSQGKSKLKYDMRSHHEMITSQIRQMSEDNQQLGWYKDELFKKDRHAKALEESLDFVTQKWRKTVEENRIVRQRTKMQHEENKEEMYLQEQFYNEQMKIIQESRDEKEENFERVQQEEREKVKLSNAANTSNAEELRQRTEEISKFIQFQDKEMEEYVEKREALIKAHEEEINAVKKYCWEKQVELEKKLNAALTSLMEEYSPVHSKDAAKDS